MKIIHNASKNIQEERLNENDPKMKALNAID